MWHYPLKLSFQNFHRLLLHHYTERWLAGTGHELMWNRFSNSRQTFWISTRICTPNPQTELSAGTSSNPNRIMKWLRDLKNLQKNEIYLLERGQNSRYYFDSCLCPDPKKLKAKLVGRQDDKVTSSSLLFTS